MTILTLVLLAALGGSPAPQVAPPTVSSGAVFRPERPPILPLPTGELQAFSINRKAMHFVDTASLRREGERVFVNYYTVFHPGAPSGNRLIVHWVSEAQVDCGARMVRNTRLSAYDEAGDEVLWLYPEESAAIEPRTVQHDLYLQVCGSPVWALTPKVMGWREALPFGRERIVREG